MHSRFMRLMRRRVIVNQLHLTKGGHDFSSNELGVIPFYSYTIFVSLFNVPRARVLGTERAHPATRAETDARNAREGLGLDFLARSREVGGQSQGRNQAHTSS